MTERTLSPFQKTISTFFVIFLYVFGWRVFSFIDIIQIISLPFAALFYSRAKIWKNTSVIAVTSAFAIMSLYGLGAVIASGGRDPMILARVLRAWLTFGGALGIVLVAYQWLRITPIQLYRMVFLSIAGHGLIMMTMYFLPNFRSFVYAVTGGVRYANTGTFLGASLQDAGVRTMGLTYGLASTSLLQMSGLPMASSFLSKADIMGFATATLGSLIIVASSLLAGRSGITIYALLSLPIIATIFISRTYPFKEKVGFASMIGILFLVSAAVWTTISVAGFGNWQITYTVNHIRGVQDVFSDHGISRTLLNMWTLPADPMQLIFGAGTFGRTQSYYVSSDVGFVLQIYAYGIVGTLLFWIPLILMAVSALSAWRAAPSMVLAFLATVIAAVIFAGKEEALYERCFWSVQALLWSMIILHRSPNLRR